MKNYSPTLNWSDQELLEVAADLRAGILDGKASKDMCYAVCAPLQGWLSFAMGMEAVLMESDFGFVEHIWLKLPDGRCLDPTADQFNGRKGWKDYPPIYLGPVTRRYSRECWEFNSPQKPRNKNMANYDRL